MQLSELAQLLSASADRPLTGEVVGVTHNSRDLQPGWLFVATKGENFDGHKFAQDAAAAGAVAVLGEGATDAYTADLPYLRVENARRALADAAAVLNGDPSASLKVVGVTGTDGKTTTSWMTRFLLRETGTPTGLLSTAGYELADAELRQFSMHVTTPEAPQVQRILAQILEQGGEAAVVESSSHALLFDRVRAVRWDVAIWTYLGEDHLNTHGGLEGYFRDKRKLIEAAPFAVLNADDPWTERLRGIAPAETTYGIDNDAQWRATDLVESAKGIHFTLTCPDGAGGRSTFEAFLPMLGQYNVRNALAAMAAAAHLGAPVDGLVAALARFPGVPGRMQPVDGGDITAVIDFAHAADSLEKALTTLRGLADGELWVVVGAAGGNRDPQKRAPMGRIACTIADRVVFTEDDPYETPVMEIIAEMERGARDAGLDNYTVLADRAEAIEYAITQAKPGALILAAGKGPETTLARNGVDIPWDELGVIRESIHRRNSR